MLKHCWQSTLRMCRIPPSLLNWTSQTYRNFRCEYRISRKSSHIWSRSGIVRFSATLILVNSKNGPPMLIRRKSLSMSVWIHMAAELDDSCISHWRMSRNGKAFWTWIPALPIPKLKMNFSRMEVSVFMRKWITCNVRTSTGAPATRTLVWHYLDGKTLWQKMNNESNSN